MKILKGKYQNGQVKLAEPAPEPGPVDVEVVFLDADDRRWDEIIRDPHPRPALSAVADEVLADHRASKITPLDPNSLDRKFLAIIERSRARIKKEGGIPAAEMRRRLKSKS